MKRPRKNVAASGRDRLLKLAKDSGEDFNVLTHYALDRAGYYGFGWIGPARHHYGLFCLLERGGALVGLGGPSLVLICGKDKPFRTVLSARDYVDVRRLGPEYLSRRPGSILR
jgi:hypothetical protein